VLVFVLRFLAPAVLVFPVAVVAVAAVAAVVGAVAVVPMKFDLVAADELFTPVVAAVFAAIGFAAVLPVFEVTAEVPAPVIAAAGAIERFLVFIFLELETLGILVLL
jgi:hypothetical protein